MAVGPDRFATHLRRLYGPRLDHRAPRAGPRSSAFVGHYGGSSLRSRHAAAEGARSRLDRCPSALRKRNGQHRHDQPSPGGPAELVQIFNGVALLQPALRRLAVRDGLQGLREPESERDLRRVFRAARRRDLHDGRIFGQGRVAGLHRRRPRSPSRTRTEPMAGGSTTRKARTHPSGRGHL